MAIRILDTDYNTKHNIRVSGVVRLSPYGNRRIDKVMSQNEETKRIVLDCISPGEDWVRIGRAKYRKGLHIIHIRYCSADRFGSSHYKFNINPNTLRAEFELWICGGSSCFYLMPMSFIKQLYDHPQAYEDYHHPDIKVVSVDIQTNEVMYARGGEKASLMKYTNASL